jgi:two-component system, OmpR family, sensor histidine kinase KdpD
MDSGHTASQKVSMPEVESLIRQERDIDGWRAWPRGPSIAASVAIVGTTAIIGHLLRSSLPATSIALLFLLAVLVSAVRYGFWTGIASSLLAFFAYNYFFVEPLFTLWVAKTEDALTLAVLLAVAATTGFLAGRLREEADAAKERAAMLEQLASFTSGIEAGKSPDDIERTMLTHLTGAASDGAVLLCLREQRLEIEAAVPPGLRLNDAELEAAERAYRRGGVQEPTAPGWSGSTFVFFALGQGRGVIGYRPRRQYARTEGHLEQLRRTILRQGQMAIERARFASDAEFARAKADREALRAALLSSLSHDLKTPLATILGGVSSLRELGDALGGEARTDMLLAVEEETQRLSRYVSNLLHMTRLSTGLELRLEWIDMADVAHSAVDRARRSFAGRTISLIAPETRVLIYGDAVLIEQALFNLIDNAVKFSQGPLPVRVSVAQEPDHIRITVSDCGQGIPQADLPHVFEPFFRAKGAAASGIGLGLAIARGIVQALAGTLSAESPLADGRGTAMHIRLPLSGAGKS